MGANSIALWNPNPFDVNVFAGAYRRGQLVYDDDFPYTFGRDKTGLALHTLMIFDFDDKVQPGDYIQAAVIAFRAAAVDTDELTVDLCLLPTDAAQQHRLNVDLSVLNSGDCAWWQTSALDYDDDRTIASVVSGTNIERPSVRMRVRDTGGGDLHDWNFSPAPTGLNAIKFRLNEFLGVDLTSMGEELTVTSGGALGEVSAYLRKFGSGFIIGDVWVEIHSGVAPYTLVATSDLISINSLAAPVADGTQVDFQFTGGDQISIVSGSVLRFTVNTSLVSQSEKGVDVVASFFNVLSDGTTTSTGAVARSHRGQLSGPRYLTPSDFPLLYGSDGSSDYNTPFGLTLRVVAPAFSVSGDIYQMDITRLLQEWVSSNEMNAVRGDVFGMQVATSLDVNTTDDRLRSFEAVSIFINSRRRGRRVNHVPRGN